MAREAAFAPRAVWAPGEKATVIMQVAFGCRTMFLQPSLVRAKSSLSEPLSAVLIAVVAAPPVLVTVTPVPWLLCPRRTLPNGMVIRSAIKAPTVAAVPERAIDAVPPGLAETESVVLSEPADDGWKRRVTMHVCPASRKLPVQVSPVISKLVVSASVAWMGPLRESPALRTTIADGWLMVPTT